MKKLLLIASLLFVSAGFAIAGNGPTKEEAQNAIAANRTVLSQKIKTMEERFAANSPQTQQSVEDVSAALFEGMKLTGVLLNVESEENQPTVNALYLKLERLNNNFRMMKADYSTHKAELIKTAQDFKAIY
jgi:hypothetical protein